MTHEQEVIQAVDKTLSSVVSIVVSKHANTADRMLPFPSTRGIVPISDEDVKVGGGSGFLVSSDGLVLTNKHVIMDPDATFSAYDQNGNKSELKILARDPIHDVAILKMLQPPRSFAVAPLGSSRNLKLGQTVVAIGNALGEFQSTVSTGVVSGLARFITAVTDVSGHQERLRGLIQTDAAINPGNSGGPLIDINGNVIGINAAVVFGAQNIGFAIPIEKAERDLADIKKYGRIKRPFVGVRYLIVNSAIQKHLGLQTGYGALVVREPVPGDHAVIPGSPADAAGIREGDILLTCNGKTITEKQTLEDMLENTNPGEKVALGILRGKDKNSVTLTLNEWR